MSGLVAWVTAVLIFAPFAYACVVGRRAQD